MKKLALLFFAVAFYISAQNVVKLSQYARPTAYPWANFGAVTTAGSNSLSTNGDFAPGDGIAIAKVGAPTTQATPGAPAVYDFTQTAGNASVSYACVGADSLEGLTAAGPATTVNNILPFGANVIGITSISRDATGKVTAVLSQMAPFYDDEGQNNWDPEIVQIWGVSPADLDGWFTVQTVAGNTITIQTQNYSAETGVLAVSGQPYSWGPMSLQIWPALAVQCPALSGTTTHYYVYANYGGGFQLIGSTGVNGYSAAPYSGTTFLDYGSFFNSGYQAPSIAQVPATLPTQPQNQMLVTTVTANTGNNLLSIAAAPTSSISTVALHDDSVQLLAAAAASGPGVLDFDGGWYVLNAPVTINTGNGSTWDFDGPVLLNEPLMTQGQSLKIISTTPSSGGLKNTQVLTGYANPMMAFTQTSVDMSGVDFEPESAGQLALYLGSYHNKICGDRFDTSYDTTILAFANGGFIDHFCDIQWSAGTQLPNHSGASIGIPNYTPPIPAFRFDATDLTFDGMNYGDFRGIEIGGSGYAYGSGSAHVEVSHVSTFQSPWTPLVFTYGRTLLMRLDIEDSTMDSNWQPVFSNLGCDICSGADFTLRANITTGGVPVWTGNPFGAQ